MTSAVIKRDTFVSGLYPGRVWHKRFRPRVHALRYDILMMLLDLDELDALDRSHRWFSRGRFNLLSFRDRDHGDGSTTPLKAQVEALLSAAGLASGGRVAVLCMPRIFGKAFNPLTLYFCHDAAERLAAILYEVNNTFGQRHSYMMPVTTAPDEIVAQTTEKQFYVSPFMDMDLTYKFRVRPMADGAEGEVLAVDIDVDDADGRMLIAAFAGRRRAITDKTLLEAALAQPFQLVKVVGGIHWEALKIWLKGVRLRGRPQAPDSPVTIGPLIPRERV